MAHHILENVLISETIPKIFEIPIFVEKVTFFKHSEWFILLDSRIMKNVEKNFYDIKCVLESIENIVKFAISSSKLH